MIDFEQVHVDWVERCRYVVWLNYVYNNPADIYLFKVINRKHQNNVWNLLKVRAAFFFINFEQTSHIVLVFPLITLNN